MCSDFGEDHDTIFFLAVVLYKNAFLTLTETGIKQMISNK